jgi:hypothetical protein
MIGEWLLFIGSKQAMPLSFATSEKIEDYSGFHSSFLNLDAKLMVDLTGGMIASPDDRFRLCRFLCTAVCDLYQGDYNPHYLTGLGALLWVINTCHYDSGLVQNALYQYLAFYFKGLRPGE